MVARTNSDNPKPLNITGNTKPNVPSFACLVYVHANDDGLVTGRVANLAGIEASGSSERTVLAKVVGEFKSRISQLLADEEEIPWIDPPQPPTENEQVRSVPMHL